MALVTLTQVKDYYGYPDSMDALVTELIDRASALVQRYTLRNFEADSYTEYLDGGGVDLILKYRPIEESSPAPVITDYADPDNPVIVDSDTYTVYPEQGFIRYSPQGYGNSILSEYAHNDTLPIAYSLWTFGARRWEVAYTGGNSTVPEDIQHATILLVGYMKESGIAGNSGTFKSERLGDYNYTLADASATSGAGQGGGMPSSVTGILDLYREVCF